jgi:predicted GIY-YIG superfamily endonuclease
MTDNAARQFFVYRAFDAEGRLLYVGCTNDSKRRWREHRLQASWAPFVTSCRMAGPFTREVARRIEAEAQEAERPAFGLMPHRPSHTYHQGEAFAAYLAGRSGRAA